MDFMSKMTGEMISQMQASGVTGLPLIFAAMSLKDIALFRLLMGLTALALGAIVARYIANIRAGDDRVELWAAVSKSVLASAAIFAVTSFLLTVATTGVL
jgi:hypothetical protein